MANLITAIVGVTLSVILVASLLIPQVKDANTTSFTSSELSLWGLITLMAIIGLVISVLATFGVG